MRFRTETVLKTLVEFLSKRYGKVFNIYYRDNGPVYVAYNGSGCELPNFNSLVYSPAEYLEESIRRIDSLMWQINTGIV